MKIRNFTNGELTFKEAERLSGLTQGHLSVLKTQGEFTGKHRKIDFDSFLEFVERRRRNSIQFQRRKNKFDLYDLPVDLPANEKISEINKTTELLVHTNPELFCI